MSRSVRSIVQSIRERAGGYALSLLAVGLLTLPLWAFQTWLTWANIALLYALLVLALGIWLGTGPSLVGALASFLLSEFFLLEPLYSFHVADPREFLDLSIYLIAGTIAGQLGAYSRRQAHLARRRASEQRLLHAMSSSLNEAADRDGVKQILEHVVRDHFKVLEFEILPNGPARVGPNGDQVTTSLVLGTGPAIYGTVQVRLESAPTEEESRLLAACVVQAAMALQRIELTEQAQRSLAFEEADRLKTALLQAVSHDLRTPLTIIKTSASNIRALHERLPEGERQEMLESIETAADQLDRMVGDLLDLSRLEAGALPLHEDWTALSDIAGDVAARAWVLHHEERIQLRIPDDMPLVRCDYGLILQALGNVVENSLRYEPAGRRIEIHGECLTDEVRLAVINHGPSIPPGQRERIMEPFYHQAGGHIGLGLAISKGIVEAHHGRFWVEDTPGGGATFILALPRESVEGQAHGDPDRG